MTLPSPICLVNGSPTPQDVPAGSTVNVALANTAGANFFSLAITSTDELNTVAAVAASLVVNSSTKTATFLAPGGLGSAVRLTSTVGITGTGQDANGVVQAALTTTFKINVVAANGQRVMAVDEKVEQSAAFGWVPIVNAALRALPMGGGGPAIAMASPPPVASFTLSGVVGLQQAGSSVLAMSAVPASNSTAEVLLPLPGGVVAAGPWAATLVCQAQMDFGQYPSVGLVVAAGATAGSKALFCGAYNYSDVLSLGAWAYLLTSQTRSISLFGGNSADLTNPIYVRIVCDGTSFLFQVSRVNGYVWRTCAVYLMATAALGTVTNYGVQVGCVNGTGHTSALVMGLQMVPLGTVAIATLVGVGGTLTVTTTPPHGLVTGAGISITGASGQNGQYDSTVLVTGPTTFTVPTIAGSGSWTGGTLIRTDV